jgi:hypothetical protein
MNESSTRVTFEHRTPTGVQRARCPSTHVSQVGLRGWIRGLALACLVVGCAEQAAYPYPYPPPPPPPPPPAVEPTPLPEPYTQPAPPGAPPSSLADAGAPPATQAPPPPASAASASTSSSQLVYTYPTGQWVYVVDEGWVWVPMGATTVEMDGIPYVYLYTPVLGWTWYVSPWGWGPYFYGPWFRHPWHPYGWHGYWVAHPHVIERLGPRGGPGHR